VLRIYFKVASSCISTRLPTFLEVFETALKITLWNVECCIGVLSWLSELSKCQHSDSLAMLDSVLKKEKIAR
jgi:hypothetical protein